MPPPPSTVSDVQKLCITYNRGHTILLYIILHNRVKFNNLQAETHDVLIIHENKFSKIIFILQKMVKIARNWSKSVFWPWEGVFWEKSGYYENEKCFYMPC